MRVESKEEETNYKHRDELGFIKTSYIALIAKHSAAHKRLKRLEKKIIARLKTAPRQLREEIFELDIQAEVLHDLIRESGLAIGKKEDDIISDLEAYENMSESRKKVYKKQELPKVLKLVIGKIDFEGAYYRRDIADKAIKR